MYKIIIIIISPFRKVRFLARLDYFFEEIQKIFFHSRFTSKGFIFPIFSKMLIMFVEVSQFLKTFRDTKVLIASHHLQQNLNGFFFTLNDRQRKN